MFNWNHIAVVHCSMCIHSVRFVSFRSEWSSSISIVSTQRFSHSLIHSLTHILLHWQYSLYEQFDSKCSIPCFNHLVMVNQTCFTHYIHYNEQIVYSPSTFPFVLIQISSTLLTRRIGGKKEETTSNRADNERLQLKWLVWIAETLKKISSNVAAIFSLEHEMFYSWRTHGTHNMSTGQLCTRISFPSSSSWVVTRLISTDYIFANSENSKNKNERGTYSCAQTQTQTQLQAWAIETNTRTYTYEFEMYFQCIYIIFLSVGIEFP